MILYLPTYFQENVHLRGVLNEGKERNEAIEFWGMVLYLYGGYIFNEYKKTFFKVKKKLLEICYNLFFYFKKDLFVFVKYI